jgi:hypothetical protein
MLLCVAPSNTAAEKTRDQVICVIPTRLRNEIAFGMRFSLNRVLQEFIEFGK